MAIAAPPEEITRAFIEPDRLARFWLSHTSAPLTIGEAVTWDFMVPGATTQTTATRLDPGKAIAWTWQDGTKVIIELERLDDESTTAVTVINQGFSGTLSEQTEAALNATEGFAIVLCDLKTLLETGRSAGLVRGKALLIQRDMS